MDGSSRKATGRKMRRDTLQEWNAEEEKQNSWLKKQEKNYGSILKEPRTREDIEGENVHW